MDVLSLVLFLFGSVGMTFIVVDGSVFQWLRDTPDWIKKKLKLTEKNKFTSWTLDKITGLLHCHQCTGFWCGFITALMILPTLTLTQSFFVAGSVSSVLSYWLAIYLNYLEAQTFVSLPKEEV